MRKFFSHLAICVTAILVIALCGCEDLGAYADTDDYCSSFGDIVLIDSASREEKAYPVSEYFYNDESRKDFLKGEERVPAKEYLYLAIPFNNSIDMDSLALYVHSEEDVTVYLSVYRITQNEWNKIRGKINEENSEDGFSDPENSEIIYGEPNPDSKIGDTKVHLQNGKWGSFVLDAFKSNGATQKSIHITEGDYVLLQIRNNSDASAFDEETGLEIERANITMTNLLVRALDIEHGDNSQGGD